MLSTEQSVLYYYYCCYYYCYYHHYVIVATIIIITMFICFSLFLNLALPFYERKYAWMRFPSC